MVEVPVAAVVGAVGVVAVGAPPPPPPPQATRVAMQTVERIFLIAFIFGLLVVTVG
jgi:hypothetical protein